MIAKKDQNQTKAELQAEVAFIETKKAGKIGFEQFREEHLHNAENAANLAADYGTDPDALPPE